MKYLKALLKFYTQSEIAEKLGYASRSTITNWMRNQKVPKNMEGRLQQLHDETVRK